ncbi:DUF1007 family protein [Vibrio ishigakensis]|uniref:DUF1007 family protein n=1 Tax=Vibrio ishigakensis TaxID=1481914 RepID=UPI0021C359C3|nr:DUF1007 family protein [Vibrio ishigakensis]
MFLIKFSKMHIRFIGYASILCALVFSTSSFAHPHSWVSTNSVLNVKDGKIVSISMDWSFDPMTTAYTFAGQRITPQNRKEVFHKLQGDILENLLYKHYFTYFYTKDEPIRYKQVDIGEISMIGPRMRLQFELELAEPVSLDTPDLSLFIFDPTYYIDMSWDKRAEVSFSDNYQGNCHIKVIEPKPTSEQIAYAMSLAVDSDPDDELGKLFTQKAVIDCDK